MYVLHLCSTFSFFFSWIFLLPFCLAKQKFIPILVQVHVSFLLIQSSYSMWSSLAKLDLQGHEQSNYIHFRGDCGLDVYCFLIYTCLCCVSLFSIISHFFNRSDNKLYLFTMQSDNNFSSLIHLSVSWISNYKINHWSKNLPHKFMTQ